MSDGKKYYCFCSSNCKYETMTKEQILAAIAQAAETGLVFDPDAAFVSKVKETNSGMNVTFWVGTQAEYNKLESIEANCLYIITDDTSKADFEKAIAQVQQAIIEAAANASAAAQKAAAAEKTAGAALPKAGGTVSGTLTLNGDIVLKEGVNYGTEAQRPAAGVKGRLYLQVVG